MEQWGLGGPGSVGSLRDHHSTRVSLPSPKLLSALFLQLEGALETVLGSEGLGAD